jgi:predicted ribosome quality control (RQC) complex YloA/Tae2 family protein
MPFDGLVLAAVQNELENKLAGSRIERIYQPYKDELILLLHRPGIRQRLVLSANAQNARVHLTGESRENPITPPLFCMVLRKHLEGGRILHFEQPGLERVLIIRTESRDELGHPSEKHLICEIMGKHSNILLVEASTRTIIDGIKRYSHSVSRHREVLPGRTYIAPPAQGKINPLHLEEEQFRQVCLDSPLDTALVELLQKRFEGLSTVTCREIVFRSNLPPETLVDHCGDYELRSLWEALQGVAVPAARGDFNPCLLTGQRDEPVDFAALDLEHPGWSRRQGEMNLLLDVFYTSREQLQRFNRAKKDVSAPLGKETRRLEKKLKIYAESLDETAGAEKLRLYGELLTANLFRLEQGSTEVALENYNLEGCPLVVIPLDPQLTPSENCQAYFKKYGKVKKTRLAVGARAKQVREELDYLEGVKTALEQAEDPDELEEIRQELVAQGYLKTPPPRKGAKKAKKERHIPRPYSFHSSDGFQLFVGKNNRQNDYLTLKMARDEDIWLHTREIPGAHVIIRTEGKEAPPATLEEAAGLAAFFSKARGSKKVPVDYTLKKHVHKPRGARPGMVIYENQKTIMAVPDRETAERLAVQGSGQSDPK